MNMVWIHAGETLSREITEILDELKVSAYYVWRNVLRRDNLGETTRWDDAVFPGKNWAVQFLCGDDFIEELRERFRIFQEDKYVGKTGVDIYIQRAEKLM